MILIDIPILFTIVYLAIWFVLLPTMVPRLRMPFRRIAPEVPWSTVHSLYYQLSHYVFAAIMVVWLVIWLINKVVGKILPWPIKNIVRRLEPFKSCKRAGLFKFIDATFELVFNVLRNPWGALVKWYAALLQFTLGPIRRAWKERRPVAGRDDQDPGGDTTPEDRAKERSRRARVSSDRDAFIYDHYTRCLLERVRDGRSDAEIAEDVSHCNWKFLDGAVEAWS